MLYSNLVASASLRSVYRKQPSSLNGWLFSFSRYLYLAFDIAITRCSKHVGLSARLPQGLAVGLAFGVKHSLAAPGARHPRQ